MVPLVSLPMVPLVANGTIGFSNGTFGKDIISFDRGSPNSTNGNFTDGAIGSNGTIGRSLNDVGIPLVPLVEP